MTDTNWPNPERPGVPMFPERDGWHNLRGKNSRGVKAAYWLADREAYAPSDIKEERAYADSHSIIGNCYNYIGPCLTATQIAELLAGERFELDVINSTLEEMRPKNDRSDWTEYAHAKSGFVDEAKKRFRAIRNLGAAP